MNYCSCLYPFEFNLLLLAAFNAAFLLMMSRVLIFLGGCSLILHTSMRVSSLFKCHFSYSGGIPKEIIQLYITSEVTISLLLPPPCFLLIVVAVIRALIYLSIF